MRLRLTHPPTQLPTYSPPPNLSLVAELRGDSVQDVQHKVIIGLLFGKKTKKKEKRNRVFEHPVPAAQPWSNKYFVRRKKIT